MESVDRFTEYRPIIEEFAAQWLASLPTDLARLIYIAKLRDIYLGSYRHPFLEENFPRTSVDQALAFCHQEVFTKFLENSFERQDADLRLTLARMEVPPSEIAARWLDLELFFTFVPSGTPVYLRNLFLTRIRSMLFALVEDHSHVPV